MENKIKRIFHIRNILLLRQEYPQQPEHCQLHRE